jgi:hypothetical protein
MGILTIIKSKNSSGTFLPLPKIYAKTKVPMISNAANPNILKE